MKTNLRWVVPAAVGAVMLAGCHTDMWVQPKLHHPYKESTFYADGNSSRPLPPNTVAFGKARSDEARFKGMVGGKLVNDLPAELELLGEKVDSRTDLKKVLKFGKERFHAYCSHCHGETGDGAGMISQRGLALKRPPATYHTDRLRAMPLGHFYDVITNGYGVMYSQSGRVPTDERWAIAAYIRVLQDSQNVRESELSPIQRDQLEKDEDKFRRLPKPAANMKERVRPGAG